MKFDVIVGNPPYQPPCSKNRGASGSRTIIWDKFVKLSLDLIHDDGYLSMVHPAGWRRPDSDLWKKMTQDNHLQFLSIHDKHEGDKTFGATTRYDWYVLQKKCPHKKHTRISDDHGMVRDVDLNLFPFLPNFMIDIFRGILAKENDDKCEVIQSYSAYEMRCDWVSPTKKGKYEFPLVRATGKTGVKLAYSSKIGVFFGRAKVIFGESDVIASAVVDYRGKYGMTNNAMAILIDSKKEGEQIKKALESDKFNEFLKACRWSNFRIDYRMFKYFKKDFWKYFV